jgi:hypothetical protein
MKSSTNKMCIHSDVSGMGKLGRRKLDLFKKKLSKEIAFQWRQYLMCKMLHVSLKIPTTKFSLVRHTKFSHVSAAFNINESV